MKKIMALLATLLISISIMGQENKLFNWGVDATLDCFESSSRGITSSVGIGIRTRIGSYDQWVNLLGEIRFIYGTRLQGFQVPLMMNLNLLKTPKVTGYLGAGFEFDFIGTYLGCMKYQAGIALNSHFDFRLFYKPYQGDIGAGFTYYF